MTILLAMLLGSYEPACLEALHRFEGSAPPGAACLAVEYDEDRGWTPTGEPAITPEGFRPHAEAWSSSDPGCRLAYRVLESEGVESFACLGGEAHASL